ncbi:MAG: hypothetical protein ACR2H3_05830 [Acidimicrobiales bacterium]
MPDSSKLRVALSALIALMLLVGLVAVVTNDDGPDGVGLTTASGDQNTAPTDDGEGTADGDTLAASGEAASEPEGQSGSASTTAKPGSKSTTESTVNQAAGQSADKPASADPGPSQPPKVGTYNYETTVDGKAGPSTLKVEAKAGGPGETRQFQTIKGESNELKNEVVFKADGLFLAASSGSSGGGLAGDCDWEPDLLVLKLPLSVGSSWSADSGCSGQSPYGPYTLKAHFEGTVTGTARVTVGGQGVDVWLIDGKQRIDITATYQAQEFQAVQEATTKTSYAPKQGLTVKEESTSTSTSPQGSRTQKTVRQLKSLTPS